MAWFTAILLLAPLALADPAVTRTTSGVVHGEMLPASSGGVAVKQFLGLPFAKAARWEPPKDFVEPYSHEPFNASMWGRACLQVLGPTTSYGSEDCLFANVWQPMGAKPGSDLPILVFIYGGSDQFGEAEPYNMSAIAAFHNTVCVNFNYRTGPIGWMAFQEDVEAGRSTGNWGILDIQAALRWVQREATALGGDAKRVGIHGQSSGGGLVELQYVSPQSKHLFSAAISESGGLSAMPVQSALASTQAAAATVGCGGRDPSQTKRCMTELADLTVTNLTYGYGWGPVVDGVSFPLDPTTMLRQGMVNPGSIVLGAQTNDSFLFVARSYTKDGLPQPNHHLDGNLRQLNTSQYLEALEQSLGQPNGTVMSAVLALYPPAHETAPSIQNVHTLARVSSDQNHCALRQRARSILRAGKGPSFVYRFNYWYQSNPECTAVPNYHLPYLGSVHQDEVTFVLGQPNFMEDGSCCGKWGLSQGEESCPRVPRCVDCFNRSLGQGYHAYFDEKEFRFARSIGTFWTNVASSGNPNSRHVGHSHGSGARSWPGSEEGGIVLDADLPTGSMSEPELYDDPKFCQLWDSVAKATKRQ